MAIAFVRVDQHPAAVAFYKDFAPEEPIAPSGVMKVATVHKLTSAAGTAYQLLKAILAKVTKKNSEILIVTHGTDEGLMLPLTTGNSTYLERDPIEIYLDTSISRADKRKKLQVTEAQLKLLEGVVQKVQKLALKRVELRACHVGQNVKTLEALRDFFGAKAAGAPDLQDAYTTTPRPFTGKSNSWWTTNASANVETMSRGSRVGYTLFGVTDVSFRFQWAVDTVDAQKEWVATHFPLGKRVARPPSIHGMLDPGGTQLIFPGDADYSTHLQSV